MAAIVLQHEMVLGLPISMEEKGFRRGRLPAEPRPLLPRADITARLRCSTAYLLLQLADVRPGDIVCDPSTPNGPRPSRPHTTEREVSEYCWLSDAPFYVEGVSNTCECFWLLGVTNTLG